MGRMSDIIRVVLLDDVRRVYDDLPALEVATHPTEGLTWYRNGPNTGGGIIGGRVIELTDGGSGVYEEHNDDTGVERP